MEIEIVVLAAGRSRRFGAANKLLAGFAGEALIVRIVRQAMMVRVTGHEVTVCVVTGGPVPAVGDEVAGALAAAGLGDVRISVNGRAADGIGTSIAAGIAGLPESIDAAVIVPGDMPFMTAEVIEAVTGAFVADGGQRPAHPVLMDGTQANPVVWPRAYFAKLMALEGDRGGKLMLAERPCCTIVLANTAFTADIDTLEDLASHQAVGKPGGQP